jgi:hypothetical protein
MIAAMVCAYKSGDVLPFTLAQLQEAEGIHRILVADGSHTGPWKPGQFVDTPSVEDVCKQFSKVEYGCFDGGTTRAYKNNRMLARLDDCIHTKWVLTVDSDEVYHEIDLARLWSFARRQRLCDRWWIRTIDPYPDLAHQIHLNDMKPRLFRWYKGARCPTSPRMHQFVFHPKQRTSAGCKYGAEAIPSHVCRMYHLNAVRPGGRSAARRIKKVSDGVVAWHGGKQVKRSAITPLDLSTLPRSLREHVKANGVLLG